MMLQITDTTRAVGAGIIGAGLILSFTNHRSAWLMLYLGLALYGGAVLLQIVTATKRD